MLGNKVQCVNEAVQLSRQCRRVATTLARVYLPSSIFRILFLGCYIGYRTTYYLSIIIWKGTDLGMDLGWLLL
jgi:hypothetical protein